MWLFKYRLYYRLRRLGCWLFRRKRSREEIQAEIDRLQQLKDEVRDSKFIRGFYWPVALRMRAEEETLLSFLGHNTTNWEANGHDQVSRSAKLTRDWALGLEVDSPSSQWQALLLIGKDLEGKHHE